jgi:hypothetical protein
VRSSVALPGFGRRHRPAAEEAGPLARLLGRFDRGELVRSLAIGFIVGVVALIALDLRDMYVAHRALDPMATGGTVRVVPERSTEQPAPAAAPRQRFLVPTLGQKLTFSLGADGVLSAEGNIDMGSAQRFAEEIEKHGDGIRTLSLNSPGGSLADAIEMARLAREAGIATHVPDGGTCASSCPLLLAGGVSRSVGEDAMIGLHQFYALEPGAGAAQAMSDAQVTAAVISRHLADMGVDPALWLHALETPPHALYFLSQEELAGYRLVTAGRTIASR